VLLPGVGMWYEFTMAAGRHVGIIAHRDGGVELVAYTGTDPDASRPVLRLTREEADAPSRTRREPSGRGIQ
jgi:TrkA domain protein